MSSTIATAPETAATETIYPVPPDMDTTSLQAFGLRSAVSAVNPRHETNLLDLLIILSRHKASILRATLTAALVAAMVALFLPKRYTATTTILPPQQSPSLATAMIGQLGGTLGPMAAMAQKDLGLKNPSDLYVGMLRSRTTEDALIKRFDLLRTYHDRRMSDARKDLEKSSTIALGKEGFVSIAVEDKDRSRAAQMANAYVEELRKLTQDLAVTEAGQRRLFFERELEVAKNNLADAEQALKTTEQKTGVIQLDGQAKAIIESVVRLRALMAAKEVELHAMRLFSTEQNPDVVLGEQQLSGLREQLSLMEKQSSNLGDVQVSTGNVPEAGLQYVRKLRDVKYAETIFELLAKQYDAARFDESRTAAVIQVVDPAVEPDHKSSPQRVLITAGGTLLGFFGSATCVLLAEAFRRMRLNPDVNGRLTMLQTSFLRSRFWPTS